MKLATKGFHELTHESEIFTFTVSFQLKVVEVQVFVGMLKDIDFNNCRWVLFLLHKVFRVEHLENTQSTLESLVRRWYLVLSALPFTVDVHDLHHVWELIQTEMVVS